MTGQKGWFQVDPVKASVNLPGSDTCQKKLPLPHAAIEEVLSLVRLFNAFRL